MIKNPVFYTILYFNDQSKNQELKDRIFNIKFLLGNIFGKQYKNTNACVYLLFFIFRDQCLCQGQWRMPTTLSV